MTWAPLDLVLLPLPGDERVAPSPATVIGHLSARRLCAAVLDAERVGVSSGVLVRLAVEAGRVLVVDDEGSVHPGPDLREVVLGLAYRVGAAVRLDDDMVVDSTGQVLDDERVLAGVEISGARRAVTAWRDESLLLADMTAAQLRGHGEARLVDGWVVTDWEPDAELPAVPIPLPERHHPVALVTRGGERRSVAFALAADRDAMEVSWVPRLHRVVDAPVATPAEHLLDELEVESVRAGADDWSRGLDPALRPLLARACDGPAGAFVAEVARVLGLPPLLGQLVEDEPVVGHEPVRVGGRSAREVAWDHIRTPSPASAAELRLQDASRRSVALHVALSLTLAAGIAAFALLRDFRFLPEWLLWGVVGLVLFEAGSTIWVRRHPAARDNENG